jgi:hypothetical protein
VTENAVLYALSTLAQTCAALAAFVGAVGLFRLQVLREQHAELKHDMLGWGEWLTGRDCRRVPLADALATIRNAETTPPRERAQYVEPLRDARRRWEAFPARLTASRRALGVFEAWNLLLIGASVAGFNYVPSLMCAPWMFSALWASALGTVGVTGYCVYAWTRG